ncbi:minor capsid protein [Tumebacillus permanentifrigoris]|uniref:minor capsid protein n=1 Tax=Tumebacillus permanentifrigoris TaxID=378543 RepID=UPI0011B29E5A|nr:minor capsid protein [Tumebacillus permanentifrigoris]
MSLDILHITEYVESVGPATAYYYDMMPDDEECVVLIEEPGDPKQSTNTEVRAFQLLVRARESPRARELIWGVYEALRERQSTKVELDGHVLYWIKAVQTPCPLGYDENRRPIFVVNYKCEVSAQPVR